MGAQASVQTHLAVDAFADSDEKIAPALPDMDDVMDDLQKELFRAIFASFSGTPADEDALQTAVQTALVRRLATIALNAAGRSTCDVTSRRRAPSTRTLSTRVWSTSRIAVNVAKKTMKKTSVTPSATLLCRSMPKARMNTGASTRRGMALNIDRSGSNAFPRSSLRAKR